MPTSGTVVTLTANVASSATTPFGGVTFYDGATMLGTASLVGGKAVFNTASFDTGQHSLTATYNANATFGGSTSQTQSVSVQSASALLVPTSTSVSETPNPHGQGVVLTASVSSIGSVPQGTVVFLMNGTILGTAFTNRAGTATLASSAVPASGQHKWWASYTGNPEFAPSASPALEESWQGTDTALTLSLDTNMVSVSMRRPTQIGVQVATSSAQATMLSCAYGLPEGYSCTFAPASLSGSGSAMLTISSMHDVATESGIAGGSMMTFCLIVFLPALRRQGLRWLIVLIALIPVLALSGCSTSLIKSENQSARMSVLVIQATSGSGSNAIVRSSQVTLRVSP